MTKRGEGGGGHKPEQPAGNRKEEFRGGVQVKRIYLRWEGECGDHWDPKTTDGEECKEI